MLKNTINYTDYYGVEKTIENPLLIENCENDYSAIKRFLNNWHVWPLKIKKVIFNDPATIVFWSDGTKTVVKCDIYDDIFDEEKGLAMAISKKFLGNKGNYYNEFKKWLPENKEEEEEEDDLYLDKIDLGISFKEAVDNVKEEIERFID